MVPLVPGLLVFVPTGQPSGLELHCQTPIRQQSPEVYCLQASLRDILRYLQRLSVCSCRGIESGRDRQGTRNTMLIKLPTIDISRTPDPMSSAGRTTVSSHVQR